MAPDRTRRVDDLETLRAFVHPLRLRLLSLLRVDGPATASDLARRVGESSGSTSYHLRQLARFGFVEDDPDQTSRRERVWRTAQDSIQVPARSFVDDPERWSVVDRLAHLQIEQWVRAVDAFLAHPEKWDPEWREAATTDDHRMRLPADRVRALNEEVMALIDRYKRETRSDPGGEIVTIFYGSVPVRDEDL